MYLFIKVFKNEARLSISENARDHKQMHSKVLAKFTRNISQIYMIQFVYIELYRNPRSVLIIVEINRRDIR